MAATAAVPQTLEVLREAAKVFDPADEVQNVKAVKQLHEQNKAAWRAEQESIAETIRALTCKLDGAKAAAATAVSSQAHSEELENKENEKFALAKKCRSDEEHCVSQEEVLKQRKAENEELKQQKQRLMTNSTVELPKIRHTVQLYNALSKIKWDYANEDAVSGFIVSDKTGPRSFNLNPQRQSQFFITNYLWDNM